MSSLNNSEFGKNIRKRRKALGITQSRLADMLEISPNHISSIETGKTDASVKLIIKLCDVLNVTPDYLFLGNMHSNNISKDIVDIIRLLSDDDLNLLYEFAKILVNRSTAKEHF